MTPIWVAFAGLLFTVSSALLLGAFKIGRMAEKVDAMKEGAAKEAGTHDDVIALKIQMGGALASLGKLETGVNGLQRQIATLMGRKDARIIEMPESAS